MRGERESLHGIKIAKERCSTRRCSSLFGKLSEFRDKKKSLDRFETPSITVSRRTMRKDRGHKKKKGGLRSGYTDGFGCVRGRVLGRLKIFHSRKKRRSRRSNFAIRCLDVGVNTTQYGDFLSQSEMERFSLSLFRRILLALERKIFNRSVSIVVDERLPSRVASC